jgi:hypothetical protein
MAEKRDASSVTWTNTIQNFFTPVDIAHMKPHGVHLDSYTYVSQHAGKIQSAVSWTPPPNPPDSSNWPLMPPQGTQGAPAWTQDMLNTFNTWMQQGCPE